MYGMHVRNDPAPQGTTSTRTIRQDGFGGGAEVGGGDNGVVGAGGQ